MDNSVCIAGWYWQVKVAESESSLVKKRTRYWRCPRPSHHRKDVRFAEVSALEEQGLTGEFGQGVGEAIAEIEAGGMAALSEVMESLAGDIDLLDAHRLDDDASPA